MFPSDNLEPQSKRWVRSIENTIETLEGAQPGLDSQLSRLQNEGTSVIDDVSSNVNAYYTATMAQYPAYQRTILMTDIFNALSKTVNVSAPAAADSTVAETWVSMFTHDITMPAAKTTVGIRLNGAQFGLRGPSAYYLRFRWRVNASIEGIGTSRWLSRHQFNLSTYNMDPTTPVLTNVTNRYVHWTGASTTTLTLELQASIQSIASIGSAVASQAITMEALDNNGKETYLDVMVTV
jgi:hypothetical protein